MSNSLATTPADFTIDSAKLLDLDFELKLEQFISDASDCNVYEASNGLWKSSSEE